MKYYIIHKNLIKLHHILKKIKPKIINILENYKRKISKYKGRQRVLRHDTKSTIHKKEY